jgi:hypothetical protein
MMALRIAALLVVLALGILAVVWPFDWPKQPTSRSQLSYAAAIVCGIGALLVFPYGHGPNVPFFATIALVAWIGLAGLWLARRNPKIPNPAWTRPPWSIADWGLIVILVLSGLATLLG